MSNIYILIAVSMVIGKGLESLFIPSFADQPPRRLGSKPDKENLGNRWQGLESRGDTPRQCAVVNLEGSKGCPGGTYGKTSVTDYMEMNKRGHTQ